MAIASTPCSPLPATTSALGYNEGRRQLQLMDGWQASKAWRANLRAEYVLSEARGRGRRRSGVGREEDSDQRCQDFYFQNFFPKNLAKKLGRVLQPEISGMVCVRVRFCSTPPPFRADEKYPRGSFPRGGFPGAAFGARDRSLGRSIGGWLSVSCLVCHIFATFDSPLSGIQANPRSRQRARHRAGSLLGCPTTGTRPIF